MLVITPWSDTQLSTLILPASSMQRTKVNSPAFPLDLGWEGGELPQSLTIQLHFLSSLTLGTNKKASSDWRSLILSGLIHQSFLEWEIMQNYEKTVDPAFGVNVVRLVIFELLLAFYPGVQCCFHGKHIFLILATTTLMGKLAKREWCKFMLD